MTINNSMTIHTTIREFEAHQDVFMSCKREVMEDLKSFTEHCNTTFCNEKWETESWRAEVVQRNERDDFAFNSNSNNNKRQPSLLSFDDETIRSSRRAG
eukprot:scaffold537_cov180-Ochromonas_danica.AAC.63